MSEIIRSPDSIFDGLKKGIGWSGLTLVIPVLVTVEPFVFKGARSVSEFWKNNLFLGIFLIVILFVGGIFGAVRAALYRWAYEKVT